MDEIFPEQENVAEEASGFHFLAIRLHDKEFLGPFASFGVAAHSCKGQGPCVIFPVAFNAAWGE